MECRTLIAHPKLPILHVLTADGRIMVIAIQVKVNHQTRDFDDGEEDDVFLSDEGMLISFFSTHLFTACRLGFKKTLTGTFTALFLMVENKHM